MKVECPRIILTSFAARVRTGFYGRGRQVTVQTVAKALSAISKTIELAGEQSLVYRGHKVCILPIERLIEGMRREDPLPRPQLAIPVVVIKKAFELAQKSNCPKKKATADLIIIAFYYLLRVGEYTKPRYTTRNGKRVKTSRTVQFRVKDVGFHKDTVVVDIPGFQRITVTMHLGNDANWQPKEWKNGANHSPGSHQRR